MTSFPIRDHFNDHVLTSKNGAMFFIDYQPTQIASVASMDLQLLVDNVVRVAKLGKAFNLPIVLSTVNVKGGQKPTVPPLKEVLSRARVRTVTSRIVPSGASSFNSNNMNPGAIFTYTFTVPGTYTYYCIYHAWMQGTITVMSG